MSSDDEAGPPAEDTAAGDGQAQAAGRGHRNEVAGQARKRSASDVERVLNLAYELFEFRQSTAGILYAVPLTGPKIARPVDDGLFKAILAQRFYVEERAVAGGGVLDDAVRVIRGRGLELAPEQAYVRAGEAGGSHWLDLGDNTGCAVQIDETGWRIVDDPPVLFHRTPVTMALEPPRPGGDLGELWEFAHIGPADRAGVLAWLHAALVPEIPHPVLTLLGRSGSGKTTAAARLASLIDPSAADKRQMPRDSDEWVTTLDGSWIALFDNVSRIPEWVADSMCRAVTGDGTVRRKLYTNRGLEVFRHRRVLMMTGIDLGPTRGDLSERMIRLDIEPFGNQERRTERELDEAWPVARAAILGALLDRHVQIMRTLPAVQVADPVRMADFHRIIAASDSLTGADDAPADRWYRRKIAGQLDDSMAGSLFVDVLKRAVLSALPEISASELKSLCEESRPDVVGRRGWPADARAVSRCLNVYGSALTGLGWTITRLNAEDGKRAAMWRIVPPTSAALW